MASYACDVSVRATVGRILVNGKDAAVHVLVHAFRVDVCVHVRCQTAVFIHVVAIGHIVGGLRHTARHDVVRVGGGLSHTAGHDVVRVGSSVHRGEGLARAGLGNTGHALRRHRIFDCVDVRIDRLCHCRVAAIRVSLCCPTFCGYVAICALLSLPTAM